MGAAYSTLCFAELVRLYNNDPTVPMTAEKDASNLQWIADMKENKFVLSDLHAFGAPRVGGVLNHSSWALNYKQAVGNHKGQSWRIASELDPITLVPPVVILFGNPWNHVDNGFLVTPTLPPIQLPTEIGTEPPLTLRPGNMKYHSTCRLSSDFIRNLLTG